MTLGLIAKIGASAPPPPPPPPSTISVTISAVDVDAALTDFPILIILDDTDFPDLFQELTDASLDGIAAAKKLTIRLSDDTPMPTEMESCDVPGGEIVLHTLVPSISSSVDTVFYIDYSTQAADNAYIDEVGTAVGQSVWDSNFIGVYHMNNDPSQGPGSLIDSTDNVNHGDPFNTWLIGYLVNGPSGKAWDFIGSNRWVWVSKSASLDLMVDEITLEAFIDPDLVVNNGFIYRGSGSNSGGDFGLAAVTAGNGWQMGLNNLDINISGGIPTTEWAHVASIYDKVNLNVLVEGVSVVSSPYSTSITNTVFNTAIGMYYSSNYEFNGRIGEVRLHDTDRSVTWLIVTAKSLHGTLLTMQLL